MDYATVARRVELQHAMASVRLSTDHIAIAGGSAAYAGPGAYTNRACALGLDGPVTDEDIEVLVQFFESRGEETSIEVSPFAHDSLFECLARRGFVLKQFGNVHVMPLTPSSVFNVGELPEGVVIEQIDKNDAALVRAFVEINERGFAPENQAPLQISLDLSTKGLTIPTSDPFIARAGNEIVAVAGSESQSGLTSLYGATVIPSWRRRGLQRALMLARLARGVVRGSNLACVMTKPGIATEQNAARLGFTMAYTRVAMRLPRRT